MARLVYQRQIVGYLDMCAWLPTSLVTHWYSLMIYIDTYVCIIEVSHFCHISDTINKRHLIIHRCFFDRCVTKIRSTTMNQKLECLCFSHRLWTHNCYFLNYFWPIPFLGYIWVRPEKFVEKTSEWWKSWKRNSLAGVLYGVKYWSSKSMSKNVSEILSNHKVVIL